MITDILGKAPTRRSSHVYGGGTFIVKGKGPIGQQGVIWLTSMPLAWPNDSNGLVG